MPPLPYRPHPLLRNGHLQTLMVGLICGHRPEYRARPILVSLSDGESLVAHEELYPTLSPSADLVVLIHGLGGDHRSPYLERLAPSLSRAGFRVWRLDLRGCGHGVEHAWRPANAGRSEDLAAVLQRAHAMYPQAPVHLVGFSLSGNIVLKFLGEAGAAVPLLPSPPTLSSAIAVAPPADLHACADNMDRWARRMYTSYYLKNLGKQVREKRNRWDQWQQIPEEPVVKTIREFDSRYTAPLSGFESAEEYYTASSAKPLLGNISIHTEILLDQDDPIVVAKSFDDVQLSDTTHITRTRHGGHMGYFARDAQGKMIRWLEYYVLHRLKQNRAALR